MGINFSCQAGIPGTVTFDDSYYTRFRIYESSTGGTAQSYGLATNGEVEDYQWSFGPTAINLYNMNASAPAVASWTPLVLSLMAFATMAILFVARIHNRRAVVSIKKE